MTVCGDVCHLPREEETRTPPNMNSGMAFLCMWLFSRRWLDGELQISSHLLVPHVITGWKDNVENNINELPQQQSQCAQNSNTNCSRKRCHCFRLRSEKTVRTRKSHSVSISIVLPHLTTFIVWSGGLKGTFSAQKKKRKRTNGFINAAKLATMSMTLRLPPPKIMLRQAMEVYNLFSTHTHTGALALKNSREILIDAY